MGSPNAGNAVAFDPMLRRRIAGVRQVSDMFVSDADGRIVYANRSAEALFGYDAAELTTRNFADLFAAESRGPALDYLAGLARAGVGGLIGDGREFTGQVRQGGVIPLFMSLGRIADDS